MKLIVSVNNVAQGEKLIVSVNNVAQTDGLK